MQAMSEMYNRTIEVFCYGKGKCFYVYINTTNPILKNYNFPSYGELYGNMLDDHFQCCNLFLIGVL